MRSVVLEKLSVICAATFSVSTATAGSGALVLGGAAVALAVPALWSSFSAWKDCPQKKAIRKARKAAEKAFADYMISGEIHLDAREPAEAALETVVEQIALNPETIRQERWKMGQIPQALLDSVAEKSEEFSGSNPDPQVIANRKLFLFVSEATINALSALDDFEKFVMPAFREHVVDQLGRIEANQERDTQKLDDLAAGQANTNELLENILAEIKSSEEGQRAAAAGVPEETLIALAKRYTEDVEDIDRAIAEIENAITIAITVREDAERGHNFGSELDEVFRRLADLTDKGRLKEAADVANREIAQWEAQQDEMQAHGLALLDAGIKQDRLNRDADGVAEKIIRKIKLETSNLTQYFEPLRAIQDQWYERGKNKGLNFDLEVSIVLARETHRIAADVDQKSIALNDLGIALQILGARESGAKRLEQAAKAYCAALEEWTRDRAPLNWATTQNNLGSTLATLGERENGTKRLEQAVKAFSAALEERTRDRAPLQWAMTQNNLGNALATLGERENGTEQLEQAVKAFSAALEEWTRDRVPLQWAMIQNNLGSTLATLGERESGTERLEQAVKAFSTALEERTRDRVPLQWAMTQNNLGSTLVTLGERESGTEWLEQAVKVFSAALEEWTRDRVPLQWAMIQNNLGTALATLGERERGTERLEQAITAFRAALEEWTRDRVPLQWAMTMENLAHVFEVFHEKTGEWSSLDKVISHAEAALDVYLEAGADYYVDTCEGFLKRLRDVEDGSSETPS